MVGWIGFISSCDLDKNSRLELAFKGRRLHLSRKDFLTGYSLTVERIREWFWKETNCTFESSILLCLVLVIISFIVNSYQQCATIALLLLVESSRQRTLFRTGNQASCFRKLLHFHHIQSYISIERSLLTESIKMSLQSLSSKRGGKSSVLSSSSTISSTNRPQPQRGIDRVDERVLNRLISELGLNRNHTVPDPHCFICRQEKHCGLNRSSLRGVRYTNNSWMICNLQNGLRQVVIKVRVSNGSSKYRDSELNRTLLVVGI